MSSNPDANPPPAPGPGPSPTGEGEETKRPARVRLPSAAATPRQETFDVEVTRRGSPQAAPEPGPLDMTAEVPETLRDPAGETASPGPAFAAGTPLAWGSPAPSSPGAPDLDEAEVLDLGVTRRAEPPAVSPEPQIGTYTETRRHAHPEDLYNVPPPRSTASPEASDETRPPLTPADLDTGMTLPGTGLTTIGLARGEFTEARRGAPAPEDTPPPDVDLDDDYVEPTLAGWNPPAEESGVEVAEPPPKADAPSLPDLAEEFVAPTVVGGGRPVADLDEEFVAPTMVGSQAAAPPGGDEEDFGVTRRGMPIDLSAPLTGPINPNMVTSRRPQDAVDYGVTAAGTMRRIIEREVDVDLGATLRGRGGAVGKAPDGSGLTSQPADDTKVRARKEPAAGGGFSTESALDLAETQRHAGGFAVEGSDLTDFAMGDTRRGDAMEVPDGGDTLSLVDTRRAYLKEIPEDKNLVTRTLEDLTYRFEIPEEELPQSDQAVMSDPALKAVLAWKERLVLVAVLVFLIALAGSLFGMFVRFARPKAWKHQEISHLNRDLSLAAGLNANAAVWLSRQPLWEQEKLLLSATTQTRNDLEQESARLAQLQKELKAAEEKLSFLQQYGNARSGQGELEAQVGEMQAKLAGLKERKDLLFAIRERVNTLPADKLQRFKFADFTETALSDKTRAQIPLPKGAQPLELVWLPPSGGRGGFWVSRYEVTWAQYLAVMGTRNNGVPPQADTSNANLPAEGIWWTDAKRFCSALNRMTASSPPAANNYFYRLPTFQEWQQYAVDRGGGVYNRGSAATVGSGGRNRLGIADVWGNVAEWLEDKASARLMNPELQLNLGFWEREQTAAGGRYLDDGAGDPASKVMTAGSNEYVEFKRGGFGFRVILAKK